MRSKTMSVRLPNSWILGAACALAVCLNGAARLGAQDQLDKFKAKEQVNAQKTLSDVKGLLEQATKDRATNPHKAKINLQDALSRLEGNNGLSDSDRAALRKQVQAQLSGLTTAIREQEAEVARLAKEAEDRAIKE